MFPNAVTEMKDENGNVVRAIDKDVLMQEINAKVVDDGQERYRFTWPDKRKSVILANAPIERTLRFEQEKSVGRDGTPGGTDSENIYIEGDNLDALKILRETYLGKVKMIYIDPPYNTGSDFIYNDDFTQNSIDYSDNSGQKDEYGNRLIQNSESNGRFHTDWLNMIYPRLLLSRDLLSDDGVIFISIDEREHDNLKKICDEIYGEQNYIVDLIWQNKKGGGNDSAHFAIEHEYILTYSKNKNDLKAFYEIYSKEYAKRYKEKDDVGRFYWDTFKRKSGKQYYPITCPDGSVLEYDDDGNPISWLRSNKRFLLDKKNGEIRFVKNENNKWSVQFKQRMPQGKKPRSIFNTISVVDNKGTTSTGSQDVYNFFKKDVFFNPKPVELLKFLIGFSTNYDSIVLDFFSGSATFGHAVMDFNAENSKRIKYILVQIPIPIESPANGTSNDATRIISNAKEVLDTIHRPHNLIEIAEERIRRAGQKIKKETGADIDYGFRCFKVDSSNMKDVYYSPAKLVQINLDQFIDNIKEGRTSEDLLIQVMLDLGLLLSSKVQKTVIEGKKVFFVDDRCLIACFDMNITEDVVTAIAKRQPYYAVFRDNSMVDDSVAANFDQIFNTYSPQTVRKVL